MTQVKDTAQATNKKNSYSNTLKNKTILITGAGRGLGEATCRLLAEEGAKIICADIDTKLSNYIAQSITESGGYALPLELDVSNEKMVRESVITITEKFKKLDILINNAAVDVTLPIDELSVEQWDKIQNVNLRGPFLMSRFCLPVMKQQKSGQIINIVSTASKRAWANAAAYHASKWGLLGLSHALHVEARPYNIKVTALVSGGMRTPFLLERFPDINLSTLQDPVNVAKTIRFILTLPKETVIPELMVIPMKETSWP